MNDSIDRKRFEELVSRYAEGDIDQESLDELSGILSGDRDAARTFVRLAEMHGDLAALGRKKSVGRSASSRRNGRLARPVRAKRSVRWGRWVSIAACLAVIVGAHLVNLRQAKRMPDVMMAKLSQMNGIVSVERNGENITVSLGMNLLLNDVVKTGRRGQVTVEYDAESTTVDVLGDTQARFWGERAAKRIDVLAGRIECDVAPQSKGEELVVITPQAKVEVKGTTFSLAVANDATRLEVAEGMVRFSRLSDGKFIDVAGGRFAVAAEGVELVALTLWDAITDVGTDEDARISRPLEPAYESGYVPGPIVFEEDFDGTLDKWEILVGDGLHNLAPIGKEIKSLATVAVLDEDRFKGMLGDSGRQVLRIRTEGTGLEDKEICVRSRRPITEEAFSVTYFISGVNASSWLAPFPWGRLVSEKEHIRRDRLPGDLCMRLDFVPRGRDEDGTPLLEMRKYMWSLRYKEFLKEQHFSTSIISCSDRRLGFSLRGAKANLVRVEVRSLVRRGTEEALD